MAQFASDSFTGVDGTTLQAYSANWVKHSSSTVDFIITDAKVRCAGAGSAVYSHANTPATADYSVSADLYVVALLPDYNYTGVAARIDPSAITYYQLRYARGIGWQLMKVVAGVGTVLGSVVWEEVAPGNTRRIKLDMAGSAITALVDGVITVAATDSSISAKGQAGLRVFNNSTTTTSNGLRLDNFSADEAGGVSAHNLTVSALGLARLLTTPAISQTHLMLAGNAELLRSIGSPTLSQAHSLAASNLALARTQGSVAISIGAAVNLLVADISCSVALSSPAITQIHELSPVLNTIAWSAGDVFIVVNDDSLIVASQTIQYMIANVAITVELNSNWVQEGVGASSWTLDSASTNTWSV